MANRSPEQDLIDSFVESLKSNANLNIQIDEIFNKNCKAKKFADIEYVAKNGQRWAIEAKSNDSKDAHNSVHKLFGELLKETGRDKREQILIGILIPESSISFYSRLFQSIDRNKFIKFGELIPVKCVFTFGQSGVLTRTWTELYDEH